MLKRLFTFSLCVMIFLQSSAWARDAQVELQETVTSEQKMKVIQLSKNLFDNSAFGQYLIRRMLKNKFASVGRYETAKQTLGDVKSSKAVAIGKMALGVSVNQVHSQAVNLVQSGLTAAIIMGAMALDSDTGCAAMKLRDMKCEFGSNFEELMKHMFSSGEFYAGMGVSMTLAPAAISLFNMTIKSVLENKEALGFAKNLMISGVHSLIMFVGFTFASQMWKEAVQYLSEDEKIIAQTVMGRVMTGQATGTDKVVLEKIKSNLTMILYESPELRNLLVYNWWRFEVATSKGMAALATMTPMMMYTLHVTKQTGKFGPKAFLITLALGTASGLLMSQLPEETYRQMTVYIQNLRAKVPTVSLFPNETELRRILKYYQDVYNFQVAAGIDVTRTADRSNVVKPTDTMNNRYVQEFKKFLEKRKAIRENYATITYEKIHEASQALFFAKQNKIVAEVALKDVELKSALANALSIDSDGRFTYANDTGCKNTYYIFPAIKNCSPRVGDYQRQVIENSTKQIPYLKTFIVEEIKRLEEFYQKEINLFQSTAAQYKDVADFEIVSSLLDEKDKMEKILSMNDAILKATLNMDRIHVPLKNVYEVQTSPHNEVTRRQAMDQAKAEMMATMTDKQKLDMAYLAASEKIITMLRDYTYTEELILKVDSGN